jgi:hypothetical protein
MMSVGPDLATTDEELVVMVTDILDEAKRHPRIRFVMAVRGHNYYHYDLRELREIPEMVPYMRRLVDFGYIAILDRSATIPELGGVDTGDQHFEYGPGQIFVFGAIEAWAFAQGLFAGGRLDLAAGHVRQFLEEGLPAAGESLRRNLRRFPHVVPEPDLILCYERTFIAENGFRIRRLRQHAIDGGLDPGDVIILVLDLEAAYARRIFDEITRAGHFADIGHSARPDQTVKIVALPYSGCRELIRPNNRGMYDRLRPPDIRVAMMMGEGRTTAMVLPGYARFDEVPMRFHGQTEADRKAGAVVPPEVWDRILPE